MQKALITGISGMVGSHLLDYLLENTDWEIDGLIRWRSSLDNLQHHIEQGNVGKRVNFLYADLRDHLSIDEAMNKSKPDYVFHLAAQSFPKTSFDAPYDTVDTNVQGTMRVLEAVKKYSRSAIVHVCSSSEVYGRVPASKLPIDEECSFHPASPYAISKVGTDLFGRFYYEAYGINTQTTRMFTHTGPRRGDVFAESSFAKQIALAEAGYIDPIIKVGNLKSLRTIADVRDAVRAYFMLVTVNVSPGAYYNIGGEHTAEVGKILEFLISKSSLSAQLKVEIDSDRIRPIDADLQVPNTSKFRSQTGWSPEYSFDQTMTDLLNYWRSQVKLKGNAFLPR
jgi:GDPmannose 4,6-dehydratase